VIYGLVIGVHLIICVVMVLVVLLQAGKGGGLAGAFGGTGGAGQALFGGRGAATFLSKATTALGITFMTTSLALALLSGGNTAPRSLVRESPDATPPPVTSEPIQLPGTEGMPGAEGINLPPVGEGTPPAAQPAAPAGETPPPVPEVSPESEESPGSTPGGN
jgi:preprotein translocase subunit SecG